MKTTAAATPPPTGRTYLLINGDEWQIIMVNDG
jgi:hypothetical protein